VVLALDELIVTETPPLYCCYGRVGEQVRVPITGSRARRVLHGALNIRSGDALLLITDAWVQQTHQAFLRMARAHWRGWHIVLFEDRGAPHTAEESLALGDELGIEVRWLPVAAPELNPMDHLWRHAKARALASRATETIDASADRVCEYILALSRRERLRQAGVLSGRSWLAD
jgi:transposase